MDNDLVSREALKTRFENYRRDCEEADDIAAAQVFADCAAELEDAPVVDAAPVRHGRWKQQCLASLFAAYVIHSKKGNVRSRIALSAVQD